MPTITVIVPVYKVELYLRQCVDSILAQTFTDFELILVDDGSPDNCGAICDEYKDKDKRVVVIHKENGGLSDARNAGIRIAKGDYLSFVDSDDYVAEKYLEVLFDALLRNNADISQCRMTPFDDGSSPIVQPSEEKTVILSGTEACHSYYNFDEHIVQVSSCAKLYNKKLFDDVQFPLGMQHEDQATTPRLLYLSDKCVFVADSCYYYRERIGSIMHQDFSSKFFDDVIAARLCADFFRKHGDSILSEQANKKARVLCARNVSRAYREHAVTQIPDEYRMTEYQAIRMLRQNCSESYFEWVFAQNYPHLLRSYLYWRKIKKMLHISRS